LALHSFAASTVAEKNLCARVIPVPLWLEPYDINTMLASRSPRKALFWSEFEVREMQLGALMLSGPYLSHYNISA
jgi:hypothetical protein